ncbi:P-loop containing nucleoside triphosphate hydrolase protein, partial [Cercophora newfieldiana]
REESPVGDGNETTDEYALVFEEGYARNQATRNTLTVNSRFILQALRAIVSSDTGLQEPLSLDSPFQLLHQHWEDIEEHHRLATDDDARAHLGLLMDFMNAELGSEHKRIHAMVRKSQINFKDLWHVFTPGEELYYSHGNHPWLLRCAKISYQESSVGGPIYLVTARNTDCSGDVAGDAELQVAIKRSSFGRDDMIRIDELPIYPLAFWVGEHVQLRKKLEDRGSTFLSVAQGAHFKYYSGAAEYLQPSPSGYLLSGPDSVGEWRPFTEIGRVIVDRSAFEVEIGAKINHIKPTDAPDPVTCPPYVIGYSPRQKTWCRYFVDNLSEIEWKADPWDSLLLQDRHKRALKVLVESQPLPENPYDEEQQKGKGLVVLLHGPHGTGKTLAAETAAESAKKIIIPLTAADLVTNLPRHASKWGAVLLLENADAVLPSHPDSNSAASASVAPLLHLMEHLPGTLLLTTTHLSSLSPALKSHVSLALGFEAPGPESRRHLWLLFLSAVPEAELDMMPDKDVDRWHLMAEKLNGREIARTVQTARTLARAE